VYIVYKPSSHCSTHCFRMTAVRKIPDRPDEENFEIFPSKAVKFSPSSKWRQFASTPPVWAPRFSVAPIFFCYSSRCRLTFSHSYIMLIIIIIIRIVHEVHSFKKASKHYNTMQKKFIKKKKKYSTDNTQFKND